MVDQRKKSSGGSKSLITKYTDQKRAKTSKNISGVKSSNRPTIAKIGIQPKDNKGNVTRNTAVNGDMV